MVAAVYLAVWGVTCMVLATVALPHIKKSLAALNLLAALSVSLLSVRSSPLNCWQSVELLLPIELAPYFANGVSQCRGETTTRLQKGLR
jgi:hypothetical protein